MTLTTVVNIRKTKKRRNMEKKIPFRRLIINMGKFSLGKRRKEKKWEEEEQKKNILSIPSRGKKG